MNDVVWAQKDVLPEPVGFRQFDNFISASADDGAQHIQAETLGLIQLDLRRDRQLFLGDHHIDQHRAVGAKRGLQRVVDLRGFFDANAFMPQASAMRAKLVSCSSVPSVR